MIGTLSRLAVGIELHCEYLRLLKCSLALYCAYETPAIPNLITYLNLLVEVAKMSD